MADEERYFKNDILAIPDLEPERSYESEGIVPETERTNGEKEKDPNQPLLDTLNDLDAVYKLADLLPAGVAQIIKDVTHVLQLDTQGRIINNLRNPIPGEYIPNISPGDREDHTQVIFTPEEKNSSNGDYVSDIFSREPVFSIKVEPRKSLVTLAREASQQDDVDIKEHYTTKMTQLSMRFYQIMCTLADEANMPDYSYLMQDFDGTAVTSVDENEQHLIDGISRNQIIYDQKLRQMQKTHTAENTLIQVRSMTSAEAQRERYLKERYKANEETLAASASNDLLEEARNRTDKQYKEAAYNYYKYLDSATKATNNLLNTTIDNASAKAQLANSGADIYAQTPLPQPTEDNVDDNYKEATAKEDAAKKFIEDQKKEAAKNVPGGSGNTPAMGGGNVDPGKVFNYLKGKGYNAAAACGIMGNIQQESGFNTGADDGVEAFGLCQWAGARQDNLKALAASTGRSATDAATQLDFLWQELQDYDSLLPGSLNNCGSPGNAAQQFEEVFERAGVPMMENRISYAEQFFSQFGGQ